MEKMTLGEIAKAVGGVLTPDVENIIIDKVTTDSRDGGDGLFIALEGEKFDGHDYINDFLMSGGQAAISHKALDCGPLIRVSDTKKALHDLARHYRAKFDIPVIAVTGSVGKTSTKDMLYCVVSQLGKALKTQGNFNNDIGVPLTLFNLDYSHKIAVIEMGMNHFGEISQLTDLARPTTVVITNIGTAHIGNLGGQEGILKAKLEILEGLSHDGLLILNGDDRLLYGLKGSLPFRTLYYGMNNLNCDLLAYNIVLGTDKGKFKLKINGQEQSFEVSVVGEHHLYNALAAIAVGLEHGIPVPDIQKGVSLFTSGSMRQNIVEVGGIKLIEDCYNASPDSMASALKVLYQIGGRGRKIAVLGDMLEMGDFAETVHRRVGQEVSEYNIDLLVTIGENSLFLADEAKKRGVTNIATFQSNADALLHLEKVVNNGDTVLIKASRGMHLEEVSKGLSAVLSA